jgi:hypothetical protein
MELLGIIVASGAVPVVLTGRPTTESAVGVFQVADMLHDLVGRQFEPIEMSALPRNADGLQINRDFLGVVGSELGPFLMQFWSLTIAIRSSRRYSFARNPN